MPGANEASNIKFSRDVLVNGKPLKAGRYSIWSIQTKVNGQLSLVKTGINGTQNTRKNQDALRIEVSAKRRQPYGIADLLLPACDIQFCNVKSSLGKTYIPFEIKLAV